MLYVSQIVMYTLNLYSAVCQLYLNKTGKKKKNDGLRNICPLLSRKQKLSWKLHPANCFHLLSDTCVIWLLLASKESGKSRVLVHYISTLNKIGVLLIRRKRKSMSGCYLSEFSEKSSLGTLNYSTLQASQHSARTSSYQGKSPHSPWEFSNSNNGGG